MRFFLLIATVFLFISCDVINEKEGYTKTYYPNTAISGRKVLLEEYTGMRCVNCPEAAKEAQLLKQTFGESLIVVSIHAGSFAIPSGIFKPDLRTEAGNSYFSYFGFAGTPIGMVNRKKQGESTALSPGNWAEAIREMLGTPEEVHIEGYAADEGDNTCRYTIKISGIPSSEKEVKLMLWLVEDSIQTPQVVPGGVNTAYIQRHVLRKALNGSWGESIVADENREWLVTRSFDLPSDIKKEQCSIVALVTKSSSKEITAVLELKLVPSEESIKQMEVLVKNYPKEYPTFADSKS